MKRRLLISLLGLVALGLLGHEIMLDSGSGTAVEVANLVRSDAVIEAKIARKKAKIEGRGGDAARIEGYGEYRRLFRSLDEDDSPFELLLEAKKHADRMPRMEANKDAGIWDWAWLGPGNIGGRIRSILLHPTQPDVMWVGAVSGGVWYTDDGGASWVPLANLLPTLTISCMVLDPDNPNTLYAGTGEGLAYRVAHGMGIFKSLDGGVSWDILPASQDPVHGRYVNDLAINPDNSQTLFAAVGGPGDGNNPAKGQIWKSLNGGLTWNVVLEALDSQFTDVAMDPDDPDVILVSSMSSVFRSTTGGDLGSWTELTTGGSSMLPDVVERTTFAFGVGNSHVFASCNTPHPGSEVLGEVWRSLNNGETWHLQSSPLHLVRQGTYDNVIWLEPGSTQNLIIGGIDLYKSTNAGDTWSLYSDGSFYHGGGSAHWDHHVIVPHINYGSITNKTIFFGNDGGIQRNRRGFDGFAYGIDSGWLNLANNLGITQFYHADASPDGGVILGGSQDNDDLRFYRSQGIQSWYQAETGDGTFCAIDPDHPLTMYGAYVFLKMQRSYDGGNTFDDIINGLGDAEDPNNALFLAPFALDKTAPNYLFAGGTSIWRSANGGNNWAQMLTPRSGRPKCSIIEIDPTTGSEVTLAGYETGLIMATYDHGLSWTELESNNGGYLPDRIVTDIEISPHNSDVIAVTLGGYHSDGVWLSINGGASWNSIQGLGNTALPSVQPSCVTFHPSHPDWIYVGTDLGVYASEDLGLTWGLTPRLNGTEGPYYVEISDLIWHSQDSLVAVTYGRGMYECRPLPTVYVDYTNAFGEQDGSFFAPFSTFGGGYNFVGPGATLNISEGEYQEGSRIINKRITVKSDPGETAVIR